MGALLYGHPKRGPSLENYSDFCLLYRPHPVAILQAPMLGSEGALFGALCILNMQGRITGASLLRLYDIPPKTSGSLGLIKAHGLERFCSAIQSQRF